MPICVCSLKTGQTQGRIIQQRGMMIGRIRHLRIIRDCQLRNNRKRKRTKTQLQERLSLRLICKRYDLIAILNIYKFEIVWYNYTCDILFNIYVGLRFAKGARFDYHTYLNISMKVCRSIKSRWRFWSAPLRFMRRTFYIDKHIIRGKAMKKIIGMVTVIAMIMWVVYTAPDGVNGIRRISKMTYDYFNPW